MNAAVIAPTLAICESRRILLVREGMFPPIRSFQGVQVSCDIASLLFRHAQIRHGGSRLDRLRCLDPAHQPVCGIRCLTCYVGAPRKGSERRSYQALGLGDAGNHMARPTAVRDNGRLTQLGVATRDHLDWLSIPAAAEHQQERHSGRGCPVDPTSGTSSSQSAGLLFLGSEPEHKTACGGTEIDQPTWHPHDEPGELLVLQRRDSPKRRTRRLDRIKRPCGEGEQSSEQTRRQTRGEAVKDARTIVDSPCPVRSEENRPEEKAGPEKAEVLHCMDERVLERGLIQCRQMPQYHCGNARCPRHGWLQ